MWHTSCMHDTKDEVYQSCQTHCWKALFQTSTRQRTGGIHECVTCTSNFSYVITLLSIQALHSARPIYMVYCGDIEGYDCLLTNELWLCCYQQGFYWTAPSYLEHAGGNSLLSVEKVLQKTFDACDCKRSVYIKAAIICYHVLLRIVAFDNHFIQHGGSGGATPDGVLRLRKFL